MSFDNAIPVALVDLLAGLHANINIQTHHCEGSTIISSNVAGAAGWECKASAEQTESGVIQTSLALTRSGSTIEQGIASVTIDFESWNKDYYVFAPSCLYNGNRYESIPTNYPPQVTESQHLGPNAPTVITDVPRLNIEDGLSRVDLLVGDLSTPAFGYYDSQQKKGFLLFFEPFSEWGGSGITFVESEDRQRASLQLKYPGLRENTRYYQFSTGQHCSPDRGRKICSGETVHCHFSCHYFDCENIHDFYHYFYQQRKCVGTGGLSPNEYSFSQTFLVQEEKYNRQNWNPEPGYYRVGLSKHQKQDFQTGWVGGGISTLPLLIAGNEASQQRAIQTVDFLIKKLQAPSGFFYGCYYKGELHGDYFRDVNLPWHLIRKSADALYFAFKHIAVLQQENDRADLIKEWTPALTRCADAFVKLWKQYGQFGQFVNHDTGEIIVGGSLCAGAAPAALALAGRYLNNALYLDVAGESAEFLFKNYADAGLTTGGPGEIAQCPDSESAFGFLESLIILYEETHDKIWLKRAEEMAWQCSSWCMSYDYPFPEQTAFGRYDLKATGSVWANVQNKHSSPGICTFSGDALLKLFRATGNTSYLDLLAEIAHNITQYLSREEKPIMAPSKQENGKIIEYAPMPSGWMNERVQTSDWNEPVGEVFNGSTWAEVACMLTAVEVPGLYWQTDTGLVKAIDHIDTSLSTDTTSLKITNPSSSPLTLRILKETKKESEEVLGQNGALVFQRVSIEPNATILIHRDATD